MQHFAKTDGLNLFRLRKYLCLISILMPILIRLYIAVSWQFLLNSTTPPSGASSSSNGTSFNGTIPSLNSTIPKTNSTTNSTPAAISGTLDATNFGKYDQLVQACLATGAHCIIDIHNYARFNGLIIGQGGPSNADFANLWSQIAVKVMSSS
jgi:endoglucanase